MAHIHGEDLASGIIRAELAKLILLSISFSLILLMCGCSDATEVIPVQPTTTLRPYFPFSPTSTSTHPIPTITAQPTLGPTATPFVHIVRKEDTLLGIAIRYGVSLEEILAANPGINPTILSIDQQIIIPGPGGDSASNFLPVATPFPLLLSEVKCYPTATEHLWCISTLENKEGFPLEGVSVEILLLNENGEVLESGLTFSPLNLIPEGGIIPFSVLFPSSSAGYAYAVAIPVTAYRASNIEERYLPLEWNLQTNQPGENRKTWSITGRLDLHGEGEKITNRVSILAIGLDTEGEIVGFRQLVIGSELRSGDTVPFEMEIFSVGPPINHIEILAEALVSVEVE
jgi:LysM repeat protein